MLPIGLSFRVEAAKWYNRIRPVTEVRASPLTGASGGRTLQGIQRLSRPISQLRPHYDVVVVGSGYGGGIAAARFARRGRSVCILERGRELHPGEYPSSPVAASHEFQVRGGDGRFGHPTGLFDLHAGRDINVLVGCGLGGTSLINANVSLRPDERIFDDERWPDALRGGSDADLEKGYEAAVRMLGANPYPGPEPAKLTALGRSATAFGLPLERPPINVTFGPRPHPDGVHQPPCTMCGNCVSGCNEGSKNTVLMTYLPEARNHGAEIFTCVQVSTVAPHPDGGWRVNLAPLEVGRERFRAPELFVHADVVVLAAGSLGSTEILLRSAAAGLPVSAQLGHHFSGNGDVIGFAFDASVTVDGFGAGRRRGPADPPGPCITGMIRLTDPDDVDRSVLIEDAVIPGALGSILPGFLGAASVLESGGAGANGHGGPGRWIASVPAAAVAAASAALAGPYRGPASRTQTFLVMSADDDRGRLVLGPSGVRVEWPNVGQRAVFARDNRDLRKAADAIGARLVVDPLWTAAFHHSLITVHPLGGAVMADDARRGVVHDRGRVFSGTSGSQVHEGLYVLDGSIVPRPLGVNPLLTISALAERGASLAARDRRWQESRRTAVAAGSPAPQAGVRFTERMSGWVGSGAADFRTGLDRGRAEGSALEFVLTIEVPDVEALALDTSLVAGITGTVTAPLLSKGRLMVTDGSFQLLVPDPDAVDTARMWYRMKLHSEEGSTFGFEGYKIVHHDRHLDAWSDTTTLFTTVRDDEGAILARGILRISPSDLLRQVTTMGATAASSRREGARRVAQFGRIFARSLLQAYGGPLDEAAAFVSAPPGPPARPLRLPAPETRWCHLGGRWDDAGGPDTWLRLTRYRGGAKGPVLLAPGFGMSTAAFVLDTIDTNLTEYLFERGYDVWLFDYRASTDLPSARSDFTLDDVARTDWPTAVQEVRDRTGADSVQVVAHCMGSMTIQMALLAGMTGVRSAVLSQVTVHPVSSLFNRVKTTLGVGRLLQAAGLRTIRPDVERDVANELLDLGLRLAPIPREERCRSAACRWIAAFYGPTHHHARLNQATHDAIGRLFGVADLTALDHISLCIRKGRAVDSEGRDVYLGHPERMAVPLLFLAGAHNHIFLPQTSERTYEWLRHHNDPALYRRHVLADYAHLDGFIGRRAAEEVFPRMVEHLDAFNPVEERTIDLLDEPRPATTS